MDFSEIGSKSRKTGLRAPSGIRKDKYDMDDIDEFFGASDGPQPPPPPPARPSRPSSSSRIGNERISSKIVKEKSPLKSPLSVSYHSDDDQEEMEMELDTSNSVIKVRNQPSNNNINDKNQNENKNNTYKDETNTLFQDDLPDLDFNDDFDDHEEVQPEPPQFRLSQQIQSQLHSINSRSSPISNNRSNDPRLQKRMTPKTDSLISNSKTSPLRKQSLFHYSDSEQEENEIRQHQQESKIQLKNGLTKINSSPLRPSARSISSLSKKILTGKTKPNKNKPIHEIQDIDKSSIRNSTYRIPEEQQNVSDDDDDTYQDTYQDSEIQSSKRQISSDSESDFDDSFVTARRNKFQRTSAISVSKSKSRPTSQVKETHIPLTTLQKRQNQHEKHDTNIESNQPTRRSSRIRIAPLAFWRNERVVYQKQRGDVVPSVKEIITIKENIEPLRQRSQSRMGGVSRSRKNSRMPSRKNSRMPSRKNSRLPSRVVTPIQSEDESERDDIIDETEDEKSKWIKTGFLKIDTYSGHGQDSKTPRLIAWAPGTENFSTSVRNQSGDNFKLSILFDQNREFIASGMMLLPPGGRKSLKSTDATYFVFYCIRGKIEVTLSGSTFIIKKGCSIEIPMGNFYQFINKNSTQDAALFFVQTKGGNDDDDDDDDDDDNDNNNDNNEYSE
ncbi:hypothetical protein WICMUC_000758 [Wickerhamomyces mucosus]|uniref:Mif2/CENP-C cupin domain-containing protein n=1 Tax=Wickerhamomyces mucosus TaxID=1378264 RepID=A0A9P8PWF5_9ASCO|nr:hypothetical protein WICMUC_000758 [Wickerhamomyces mucosus]